MPVLLNMKAGSSNAQTMMQLLALNPDWRQQQPLKRYKACQLVMSLGALS